VSFGHSRSQTRLLAWEGGYLATAVFRVAQRLICAWENMVITTKTEKLLFPLFVLLFEVVFLVLFGTLVEYDEGGAPHTALNSSARVLQSSRITTKLYPCKSLWRSTLQCR